MLFSQSPSEIYCPVLLFCPLARWNHADDYALFSFEGHAKPRIVVLQRFTGHSPGKPKMVMLNLSTFPDSFVPLPLNAFRLHHIASIINGWLDKKKTRFLIIRELCYCYYTIPTW